MTAALRLGAAEARTGQKTFGHIPVELPEGGRVGVACWMVRGREDGPVLYVHSTQHGNEISGIEVVRRVVPGLNPRKLRGTVIGVPIANPLAFGWRRHHYLQGPEEAYQARPELDIDHFWPGDPGGTHVQRLAHALWHAAVRHATHVLDMHTWNRWQAAATTVRAWHAPSLELAKAFGLWVQRRPEQMGDKDETGSITSAAIRERKAACAPNFTGQWDIYEGEVRRGVVGLRNVLRHLGMIEGEPREQVFANNTAASANVAAACTALGITRVVYASSITVYGLDWQARNRGLTRLPADEDTPKRPDDFYALSKWVGEEIFTLAAQEHGLHVASLRIALVVGPDEYTQRGQPRDQVDASAGLWAYVDSRDVGQAARLAAERLDELGPGNHPFNVAAADPHSRLPLSQVIPTFIPDLAPLSAPLTDPNALAYSITKAQSQLGYSPKHSWRDAIS